MRENKPIDLRGDSGLWAYEEYCWELLAVHQLVYQVGGDGEDRGLDGDVADDVHGFS
jgi:hypothetical protein